MEQKYRLKIIVGLDDERVENHARSVVRELAKWELKNPHHATPLGVQAAAARHQQHCDECGLIFWSSDPYARHVNCPGSKRKVGF